MTVYLTEIYIMEITTLKGQKIKWNPKNKPRSNPSKLHLEARTVLKEEFPMMRVYEEVYVPRDKFYFDFYIPTQKIAIEVQGQQHYNHTPYYHTSKLDYFQSLRKDLNKKKWCEINNITLIELPWSKQDEWRRIIKSRGIVEANGDNA